MSSRELCQQKPSRPFIFRVSYLRFYTVIWDSSNRITEINNICAPHFIKSYIYTRKYLMNKANWKPIEFYYKQVNYKVCYGLSSPPLCNLIVKSNTRSTKNKHKLNYLYLSSSKCLEPSPNQIYTRKTSISATG